MMLIAVGLAGCASSYRVVQFPHREADLYPLSQTRGGISVAIDEVMDPERARRYFGTDLTRHAILPVAVVISNNGERRIALKPSDVLLHQGMQVIDPLPIEAVVTLAKNQRWFLGSKTGKELVAYFDELTFKEMVLTPGETYQGVMFFPLKQQERDSDRLFSVLPLFPESGLKVLVGARDVETGSRLHFGPFSLSLPRREGD
jgi:hypothetical protein